MNVILLSGGSGKRLWPLSNDVRSKQFLKLLVNPEGGNESMVQRVYRQLKKVGYWESITVAAGASQKDQIELQLGKDINLVIEPERRDTFPAIALACAFLYSEKKIDINSNIAVLPVDPYVDDDGLVLLGAKPIFPSEKYGYIVPDDNDNTVKYFKEKPSIMLAKELIKQGAMWNCGVFCLKLRYVFNILKEKYGVDDFSYLNIYELFSNLKKSSFDYEVVEKAEKIRFIKYSGPWKDLGTWETFTEEINEYATGNVVIDKSCNNTHVINEQGLPVVAMGLENTVIVACHDGILVANKGQTHKLKEFASELSYRPMYEERRWGTYTVLDRTMDKEIGSITKKISLNRDSQISYQYHDCRKEIWSIISGKGLLYLNGTKREVCAGEVIEIETGVKHGLKAIMPLEMIEVQIGTNLVEDDIVRLEYDWI